MMQNEVDRISVIIPVKNEENKIEKCLHAVFSQSLKPHEVIVVDGNSTDNTVKNAKNYPVTILYENYGTRAGACHIGIQHAKGEYIAFTDADCIPEKNWLEVELNILKKHKNAAGVGCRIKNVSKGIWEETINETSKTFIGSGRSIQGRQFGNEKKVLSISGCHALYRKKMLQEVGGFSVKLKTCEDTEINKKLRKFGYDLIYTPNTAILHNHTRGTKLFAKRMFQYGYGRAQSRLFDMQLLLPLSLPILILLLFFLPIFFFSIFILYLITIFMFTVLITTENKKPQFLITVPIITFIQHIMYSMGFWKGLVIG